MTEHRGQCDPNQLLREIGDPAISLSVRDEGVRRNPALCRVTPARKQLKAMQFAGTQVHDGLKVGEKLAVPQTPFYIVSLNDHCRQPSQAHQVTLHE